VQCLRHCSTNSGTQRSSDNRSVCVALGSTDRITVCHPNCSAIRCTDSKPNGSDSVTNGCSNTRADCAANQSTHSDQLRPPERMHWWGQRAVQSGQPKPLLSVQRGNAHLRSWFPRMQTVLPLRQLPAKQRESHCGPVQKQHWPVQCVQFVECVPYQPPTFVRKHHAHHDNDNDADNDGYHL
jgi:hypothetical protein